MTFALVLPTHTVTEVEACKFNSTKTNYLDLDFLRHDHGHPLFILDVIHPSEFDG